MEEEFSQLLLHGQGVYYAIAIRARTLGRANYGLRQASGSTVKLLQIPLDSYTL